MHLNPSLTKLIAALRRAGHACDISAISAISAGSAGHAGRGIRVSLADHMQHAARLADALHDEGFPCRICTATKTLVLC